MSEEAVVQEVVQQTEVTQEPQQTEVVTEQAEEKPPKTFTQEELDAQIAKRLSRERKKFDREAQELRQLALQRSQETQAPPKQAQGMPKIEDFQDFESYLNARDAFLTQKLKGETIAEYEQRQQAERAERERQKTLDTYQKRVAQAVKELPDFDDVVYRPDVTISDVMAHTIMESDAGPKVAYYLGTHPDEAERIADLSPVAAIKELTRIEDKLSKTKATNTPPPTNPVGSRAKAEKDPSDMSLPEFIKYREAYVRKHR